MGGGATAAVLTLVTAIDESRKETAKGVAGFPNRFSGSDGHPYFYHCLEYDVLSPPPCLSFNFVACCFVSPFVFFPLPAVNTTMPVSSSPSSGFVRAAAICPSRVRMYAFHLLIAAFLIYILASFYSVSLQNLFVLLSFVPVFWCFSFVLLCSRTRYWHFACLTLGFSIIFLFSVFLCLTAVCDQPRNTVIYLG